MPKKEEKASLTQTEAAAPAYYDRLIVCQFEDESPFSYIGRDIKDSEGRLWTEVIGKKMNPFEKLEDHMRNYIFKIKDEFTGDERIVRVFARVQDGVSMERLNNVLDELNEELTEGSMKHMSADYQSMVEHWYEKMMSDIAFVRRLPGDKFRFPLLNRMNTRRMIETSKPPITDESDGRDQFQQKAYRHGEQTKITLEDPAIVAAKKEVPKTSSESVTVAASDTELNKAFALPTGGFEDEMEQVPEVIFEDSQESSQVVAEIVLETSTQEPPVGANVIDPDAILRQHMQELPEGLWTEDKIEEPPTLQRTISVMPDRLAQLIDGDDLAEAIDRSVRGTAAEDELNKSLTLDRTRELPEAEQEGQAGPSKRRESLIVRGNASNKEIMDAIIYLHEWLVEKIEALDKKYETLFLKLNKKLDNKFQGFNALKIQTRDIHENVANMSLTEQVRVNTLGNIKANPEAKSLAWGILFRVIPFNLMGKQADIFFAFLFVQEQMVEYITPTLESLPTKNMNVFLARNCLMNTFTQMARAHLITGCNSNSMRMLTAIKRPLMKGFFVMINKRLIPKLCVMKKLDPEKDRHQFADIQTPASKNFSNEYGALLTNAAMQSPTLEEAGEIVTDWDFQFHNANKHTLPSYVKPLGTRKSHIDAVSKRSEMVKAMNIKKPGDRVYLPKEQRLTDMFRDQGVEVSVDEMLDIIMVSAYLLGYDQNNLVHELLPDTVPELPELYEAAIARNANILDVVERYSADARNNIPHLYVDQLSKKGRKRENKEDEADDGEATEEEPKRKRRSGSRRGSSGSVSPIKRYPFTQFKKDEQPKSRTVAKSAVELDSDEDFRPEPTEEEKIEKEQRNLELARRQLARVAERRSADHPPKRPHHLSFMTGPSTSAAAKDADDSAKTQPELSKLSSLEEVTEDAIKTPPRAKKD